jgi:hypothetical protein
MCTMSTPTEVEESMPESSYGQLAQLYGTARLGSDGDQHTRTVEDEPSRSVVKVHEGEGWVWVWG